MGDENDRSMETKLEYEEEEEEEDEDDDEDENEDEDELDEPKELEEMLPPRLSWWVGADGKQHLEILVINNDINNKNKLQMIEPCSICYLPFSTQGNHQICALNATPYVNMRMSYLFMPLVSAIVLIKRIKKKTRSPRVLISIAKLGVEKDMVASNCMTIMELRSTPTVTSRLVMQLLFGSKINEACL
nr:hypothetical protein [Tanacetum cinerariifolium]